MIYTVTITSQGQFTIPAEIRRELGLDKTNKAFIDIKDGQIIIWAATDILEMEGVFKNKSKISKIGK